MSTRKAGTKWNHDTERPRRAAAIVAALPRGTRHGPRLTALWVLAAAAIGVGSALAVVPDDSNSLTAQHAVIAELGGEHIAHAIYRRGSNGERITAWGDRVLEWPLNGSRDPVEVVPAQTGRGYSNGACAVDMTGDDVDELVIARGEGRWGRNPELVWFEEIARQRTPTCRLRCGRTRAPRGDTATTARRLPTGR